MLFSIKKGYDEAAAQIDEAIANVKILVIKTLCPYKLCFEQHMTKAIECC